MRSTYLEKMASNLAGTNLPSVSYVAVSEPCLARWMFLTLTGKSGCGIHDSEVNHEKAGEMMLVGCQGEYEYAVGARKEVEKEKKDGPDGEEAPWQGVAELVETKLRPDVTKGSALARCSDRKYSQGALSRNEDVQKHPTAR